MAWTYIWWRVMPQQPWLDGWPSSSCSANVLHSSYSWLTLTAWLSLLVCLYVSRIISVGLCRRLALSGDRLTAFVTVNASSIPSTDSHWNIDVSPTENAILMHRFNATIYKANSEPNVADTGSPLIPPCEILRESGPPHPPRGYVPELIRIFLYFVKIIARVLGTVCSYNRQRIYCREIWPCSYITAVCITGFARPMQNLISHIVRLMFIKILRNVSIDQYFSYHFPF